MGRRRINGEQHRPTDVSANFDEHIKLMYDLQVLGFQADVTRVFTMIVCRELSTRTYAQIGVPDQHHPVSHHRNDAELTVKKAKIDTYHVQLLAYFLQKLQTSQDGAGSILDQSLILYGGGGRRQPKQTLEFAVPDGWEARWPIPDRTA